MKTGRTRKELWSVAVLCALIIGNILLYLPTHLALSESKPARAAEAKHTDDGLSPSDFGAETVEPLPKSATSKQDASGAASTAPLPPDVAEDRYTPEATTKHGQAGNDTMTGGTPEKGGPRSGQAPQSPGTNGSESEVAANNGEEGGANEAVTTILNGSEIEIAALVKAFSKLTKRNYIVDNSVKGKIAIHLATPVSIEEALRIFESVLLLKGFTTVPMGDNTWKVITAKDARQTTIPNLASAQDKGSDALVTQLVRLKNIQATEIQQVLAQFVSKDGMVSAFGATNAVILIDSAANIRRLQKMIEQLDVPALDQDITIVPILHAEAKDIAEKLENILGEKDKSQDQRPGGVTNPLLNRPLAIPPVPGQPIQANPQGVSTGGDRRQLPLKVIPDDRTNSIIVVADQALTERVRALVEQLDSPINRAGGKFYVYRLQHADAEELSQIINAVIGGGSGGGSTSTGTSSSGRSGTSLGGSGSGSDRGFGGGGSSFSRSGSSSNRSSFGSSSGGGFGSSNESGREGFGSSGGGLGGTNGTRSGGVSAIKLGNGEGGKVNLEGEVTVAADSSTNSLVINSSRGDYEKLKELIKDLDVKRHQVLVEATILEVSLKRNKETGVEWQTTAATDSGGVFAQNNFGGLTNIISNPAALSDLTIAAASSGSIVLPGGIALPSQALLVTALSNNSDVNILSTPTIVATDKQEAEIVVGQNVPFITSTSTNQTNLNNTFNQIERQDVGIKLRIVPQISAGDFVIMKIFIEISNVADGTKNDARGPTTNLRTTETMVEVKSNQMIVTGGLISDQVTTADRGIPYLEDVPVLGNLFRTDRDTRERTNLLVFITPRIIADQFEARKQTKTKRAELGRVIEEQESEPDRHEVLNSPDVDNVVEEYTGSEIHPSTVTPPKTAANMRGDTSGRASAPTALEDDVVAKERTEARLRSMGQPSVGGGASDEEVEVSVRPRLPGAAADETSASAGRRALNAPGPASKQSPSSKQSSATNGDSGEEYGDRPLPPKRQPAESDLQLPTARGEERGRMGGVAEGGSRTYVVLRAVKQSGSDRDARLPFRFLDQDKTVAISLVGGLNSPSGRFFEVGRRYRFRHGGASVEFICLEKFGARAEAAVLHPGLQQAQAWYTLSPEQSLGLGRGDWLAAE